QKKSRKFSFYFAIALVAIGAVTAGFMTTYIQPVLGSGIDVPAVVHLHGAFSFAWIVLFFMQTVAVKSLNFKLHQRMGVAALAAAVGIVLTLLPVGLFQVRKELALGYGESAISAIVGIVTTGIMFSILVALGFRYRRKPKVHKRLMLLATIIIL